MNAAATPVAVASSSGFVAISSGFWHTCGITTAGAALCWGSNDNGQLGTGNTQSHSRPVAVSGGITFAAVGAGGYYSCGLDTGGSAWCWGDNQFGELGTGVASPSSLVPAEAAGGLQFHTLSTGNYHACGMAAGNVAYCWGDNVQGGLGNGTTNLSSRPVKVIYQP
jgi:alpha-tubulin suppressor-like RCC1 family protein